MTTAMITQHGTIRARHSVREDFSACSSGNGSVTYYGSKAAAVCSYASVLDTYGLCFDRDDFMEMSGDDGRISVAIHTDEYEWGGPAGQGDCVGCAILMWYRMENSGRYEFTGYIA